MAKTRTSTYEWPKSATAERQEIMAHLIWLIQHHGPFESPEGSATAMVGNELRAIGYHFTQTYISKLLADIDAGGAFGQFIERDMRSRDKDGNIGSKISKRTYAVIPTRTPGVDPFPPDPFLDGTPEIGEPDEIEEVEEVLDLEEPVNIRELAARAAALRAGQDDDEPEDDDEVIEDIDAPEPQLVATGLAVIEHAPPADVTQKLLMVQSVIAEVLGDLATAPFEGVNAYIQGQLSTVDQLLTERDELRRQVAERDEAIIILKRALTGTAARNGTGTRLPV